MKKLIFAVLFYGVSSVAFAAVPIVDYSNNADPATIVGSDDEIAKTSPVDGDSVTADDATSTRVGLSVEQRLEKLERQVDNLNQQNTAQKIEDLQDRIQKLNGQLEDQSHQIAQLTEQVKNFYQDLNGRIEGKGGKASDGAKATLAADSVSQTADTAVPHSQSCSVPPTTFLQQAKSPAAVKKSSQLASDTAFLKEQQMYQTALDLLPDKKYDASAEKLHKYISTYPKGAYVANAHYWLGEISFLKKNLSQAEVEFHTVVSKYPTAKKMPDALLKIALIHDIQGKHDQAKGELQQVIDHYPNTAAAQLAKQQLEVPG